MPRQLPLAFVCLGFALVACSPADPAAGETPSLQTSTSALRSDNGKTLNGKTLNGKTLNGTDLTGMLVSVDYAGIRVNGESILDGAYLEGTTFRGWKGSSHWSGADFLYAKLNGNLGDGSDVPLRIRQMAPGPVGNSDLTQYYVEYRGADSTWRPICTDENGNDTWAIPLDGEWDYRQGVPGGGSHRKGTGTFTFACMDAALAKCTLLGYRPWTTYNDVDLAPYHQTCVRLLRADYCGDGASYTKDGTLVNLYDTLGIQTDTENWIFEAEWDPNGARCFYPLNRSGSAIPCYDSRVSLFCGQTLTPTRGVHFVNETRSLGLLD